MCGVYKRFSTLLGLKFFLCVEFLKSSTKSLKIVLENITINNFLYLFILLFVLGQANSSTECQIYEEEI